MTDKNKPVATGVDVTDISESDARPGEPLMMHVRVASPFKTFFDDKAYSISGVNDSGAFDILPHHHNFIALLTESELVVATRSTIPTRIKISGGIMHVKADQIIVFLNV